jgi:hypothetical protein
MSRESFMAAMREALSRDVAVHRGQPTRADIIAYMRTLRDHPDRALAAYQEYVRAFYIHTEQVAGDPDADVAWPGESCDHWRELAERPRHQQRRIIDCEGYAYIAAELLTAAGWTLRGYQVLYILPAGTSGWDHHIVAILDYPGDMPRRVYIGSDRVSTSAVSEAHHVWPHGSFNARYGPVERTARGAIDEAARQIEQGPRREVAPLRGRRSMSPPVAGD